MARQPDPTFSDFTIDELRVRLADAEKARHYRQGVVYAMEHVRVLRAEIHRREQVAAAELRAGLEALISEAATEPAMTPQQCQQQQAHAGKVNGAKSTPRGGYIVHRRGDSSQKLMTPPHRLVFEHSTLDAAIAEAERLAARHNREFAVFAEISAVLPPAVEAAQQSDVA
jgi:hypothetical protein